MMPASVTPWPPPPYSSGMSTDSQPSLVISVTNCAGYSPFASRSRQYWPGNRAQTSRTASRMSTWSGVSEKSMPNPELILVQAEDPGRVLVQQPFPRRPGQVERAEFGEAPLGGQEREVAAPQELAGQPPAQLAGQLGRDAARGPAGDVDVDVGLVQGHGDQFHVPRPAEVRGHHGQPRMGGRDGVQPDRARVVKADALATWLARADSAGPGVEQGQQAVFLAGGEHGPVGGVVGGEGLQRGVELDP